MIKDWMNRLQLQYFLYDLREQTYVLIYWENRILKIIVEDRVFRLAIEISLRCKWVLTCKLTVFYKKVSEEFKKM